MRKMSPDASLKRIRMKYNVPAFRGVTVKTSAGDIGIIVGGSGFVLRVWIEDSKQVIFFDPEDVDFCGNSLKE